MGGAALALSSGSVRLSIAPCRACPARIAVPTAVATAALMHEPDPLYQLDRWLIQFRVCM
jgi:hypothetical protein